MDCLAGGSFGVKPILFGTGYGKEELEKAKKEGKQDFSYFPTFLLNRASSSSVSSGNLHQKRVGAGLLLLILKTAHPSVYCFCQDYIFS